MTGWRNRFLTLLCESAPMMRLLPPANGNDSATSFKAALAFAVKTTVYSDGDALKYVRTACRASSAHLSESFELQPRKYLVLAVQKECIHSPVADGMSIAEDIAVEKVSVDPNQAFRIEGSTHIVDVGFACAFQPRKVSSTESVENPS